MNKEEQIIPHPYTFRPARSVKENGTIRWFDIPNGNELPPYVGYGDDAQEKVNAWYTTMKEKQINETQILNNYFDEMHWKGDMRTLENLIESHRTRGEIIKEHNAAFSKTREELVKENERYLLMRFEDKYIEREKLRSMTLEEIMNEF